MKLRDVFELVLLAMLWGGSFILIRVAVPEFGVIALMALRVTIGSLCLFPVLLLKKGLPDIKRHFKPIFVVGLFNSAVPFCLLAFAAVTFTAGFTSIINATVPLWSAIITLVLLKQQSSKAAQVGLLVGFCGVIVMVWDKLVIAEDGFVPALIAGLLATLSYGAIAIYTKKALQGVNPISIACGSLFCASLVLLPLSVFFWPQQAISAQAWIALLIMSAASTAFAVVLFFRLIASVGPSKAITVTYLIPLFGMLFGAVLLDEVITSEMLAGCGLILLGVGLATGLVKGKRTSIKKEAHSNG
ncbi:MAG: DMT family transporter [Algicola sp.]|nr:DMT family transporter [Algicola sp.]